MHNVVEIGEYIARTVLSLMIREGRIQLPRAAAGSNVQADLQQALQRGLKASIIDASRAITGVKIRPEELNIILSAGFLCERWCSAFRLAKIYNGNAQGFADYEIAGPSQGTSVGWPDDIPLPSVADDPVVRITNTLFPIVATATVLHEVGHVVNQGKHEMKIETELACDAYAMDYVLGTADPKGMEIVVLGIATWLCCLCSEVLLYTDLECRTHPSPVRRMEEFVEWYLVPNGANPSIAVIELMCVGHIVNLARIRRPDECDAVCARNFASQFDLLHALRTCWEPVA